MWGYTAKPPGRCHRPISIRYPHITYMKFSDVAG